MVKDITANAAGTITLGGDLTVNRLGYGAMRITGKGIWGKPENHDEAIRTMRRAVELGVNFIDTADSYGPYVSEELIAEALAPYKDGVIVATKAGWERPGPGQWTHNASPAHLRKALEGSLQRLRLERMDVYQLHTPDLAVSFDASMETLAKLKEEGKIRHVALSNVTLEHIERARKIVPIVSVQNRYSFADREWDYVLNHCEKNGIAFYLGRRWLADANRTTFCRQFQPSLTPTPQQVGLAWLLKRSPIVLPIPGTSSVKHVEENIAAAGFELPDVDFNELSAVEPRCQLSLGSSLVSAGLSLRSMVFRPALQIFCAAFVLVSAVSAASDEARWAAQARRVTITRDDWGIAHVHGKTDADAVFGMVYAQAEDDFNRVETNYLNSMGRLAEPKASRRFIRTPDEAVHRS